MQVAHMYLNTTARSSIQPFIHIVHLSPLTHLILLLSSSHTTQQLPPALSLSSIALPHFFTPPVAGFAAGLPVTVGFFCACAAAGVEEGFGAGFFAAFAAGVDGFVGGFFAAEAADAAGGLPAGFAAGLPVTVPALFCPEAVASLLFAACARARFAALVLARLLCFSLGPIVFGAGVLGFGCASPLFGALYFGMPVIFAASLFLVRPRGLDAEPARTPGAPVASRT